MRLKNKRMSFAEGEKGFTLLEVLACLVVSSLMLAAFAGLWRQGVTQSEEVHAGRHLAEVMKAGLRFCQGNYVSLQQEAKDQSGPAITIEDLKEAELLPEGFAEKNAWHQTPILHVRSRTLPSGETALYLLALTCGGRGADYDAGNAAFLNIEAPSAARKAGAYAGFIAGENNAAGAGAGHLVSAYGGYDLDLADFGLEAPEPGHLGAYCLLDAASSNEDVLHRVAVPGHPELNQMTVNLDMTKNAINNASSLQLVSFSQSDPRRPIKAGEGCSEEDLGRLFLDESYGLYLCRQLPGKTSPELVLLNDSGNGQTVSAATLATDQSLIQKPDCSAEAGMQPAVFLAPAIASSGPKSPAMASFRAWAEEEGSQAWRIHLKIKNMEHAGTEQWYSALEEGSELAPYYGSALVLTMCARKEAADAAKEGE